MFRTDCVLPVDLPAFHRLHPCRSIKLRKLAIAESLSREGTSPVRAPQEIKADVRFPDVT
jgi:hypothetical protein